MKIKRTYFFTAVLLAGIFINAASFAQNQEKITMTIEGKKYVLLTAYTTHEKSKGLSVIRELKDADGMVFYFNPPEKAIIWNKDTHLDLEIIWLFKGRVVGRDLLPPEEKSGIVVKTAPKIVDQAVEIVRKQKNMVFKNKILLVLAIFVLSASFVFADVITKFNTDKKQIAITFDACETYSPAYFDMKILDYLVSEQIPVTLFLSGKFIKRNLEKVKELSALGFIEIENHSLKHRHMKSISKNIVVEEIIENEALIAETTGTIPRFFRFPFGEYDKESLDAAESLGYKVVHWSFESGDPDPSITTKSLIIKTLAKTKPGSILIFHINSRGWRTKEALPVILEQLKLEGYEFVLLRDVISSSRKLHLSYDDLL